MKFCRSFFTAALLASACALAGQSVQTPTPPIQPGVIRINVNLVQVDAVVTDRDGKPVTNLKVEDFELLQDGEPQKITNFEFVNVRESAANTLSRLFSVQPRNGPVPSPTVTLRPDQIRRTIALVVDDMALSFESTVRVRESLKKWVENEMLSGDLVAVVRTSAGMGSLQQFTADKQMLAAAIDRVRFSLGRVGVSSFGPISAGGSTSPSLFDEEVTLAYQVGSLGAIRYVVRGLREMPGRKSVILFSESMRMTFLTNPGIASTPEATQLTGEDGLRKLADEANRSSVVIYTIDPRGVVYTGLTAEDSASGDAARQIVANRSQQLIESRDGMELLAHKTGGLFVHDNNDLPGLLRQAVNDGNGYYLMGYQPAESTFEQPSRNPRFHSIKLNVKRPGLTVRSRTGFFGTPDNRVAPRPQTRQQQIAKALVSPFSTGDLSLRLTTLFSHTDKDGSSVSALLHFPAEALTFKEQPDGQQSTALDVVVTLFNGDGELASSVDKTWTVRLTEKGYAEVLKKGVVYSTAIPVKKPGPYQMRVVLRDTASERVGSASQFIDVPDIKKGRLTLSGIALSAERAQPPSSGSSSENTFDRDDPNGTPAVRIFKPGAAVTYAYEIFNGNKGSQKPLLETQVRLFQDGQQIYTSTPTAMINNADPKSKRMIAGGRMQLTRIPAGTYVLQILVKDTRRKGKDGIAAQAIDFEIRD